MKKFKIKWQLIYNGDTVKSERILYVAANNVEEAERKAKVHMMFEFPSAIHIGSILTQYM